MITKEQYKQFKAYATQYGTFVGLVWIGSFAAYIIGLRNPSVAILFPLLWIVSIFLSVRFGKRFYKKANYTSFSYRRAFWFMLRLFMYASLLTTFVQFIYFRFIDNGYVVNSYLSMLNDPVYAEQINQLVSAESLEMVNEALPTITPTQFTFNLLTINLFLSFLLAFPTAFIIMKRPSLAQ